MLDSIRTAVSKMWGAGTTHILAGLFALQGLLSQTDPELFANKLIPRVAFGVGIFVIFLRIWAPSEKVSPTHVDGPETSERV